MRKIPFVKTMLYLLYLCACIIVVDLLFYRAYLRRALPEYGRSRETTEDDLMDDRDSTPNHFVTAKPAGIVRIGCFGDSFTHGDEVDEYSDFPSCLRRLLSRAGLRNVEVINFGKGGIGFHRAFDLWKFAAAQYGLDYAVIGPSCFQTTRDATFSEDFAYPARNALQFLHPRYIRTQEGLRQIPLAGPDRSNRLPAYTRFIPLLRYLRYDLRAPVFLAAPLYFLAPGRALANPFYYRRDVSEEMDEIYRLQLDEIASRTPQVIVFNKEPRIVRLAAALKRDNVASFAVDWPLGFPFRAVGGHLGPVGNRFLAQLLFSSLTGSSASRQAVLAFSPPPFGAASVRAQSSTPRLLSQYRDIYVEAARIPLGRFYDPAVGWMRYCSPRACESSVDVFKAAVGLVGFSVRGESLVDSPYLALDFPLRDGMRITAKTYSGGHRVAEKEIGRIRFLGGGFPVGWADIGRLSSDLDFGLDAAADAVELCIAGRVVLSGKKDGARPSARLAPSAGSTFLLIRADGRVRFDPDAAPASGIARLCFRDAAATACTPIAAFEKQKMVFPVAAARRPLAKADSPLVIGGRLE